MLTALIPMLPVRDMPASVVFYCDKLGFEVERREDSWRWAMIRSGPANSSAVKLMLDESINLHDGAPKLAVMYFYPDDIAAYHADLKARGTDVPEMHTTFYGMREFEIEDLDGNRLCFGQVNVETAE